MQKGDNALAFFFVLLFLEAENPTFLYLMMVGNYLSLVLIPLFCSLPFMSLLWLSLIE